MLEKQDVITIKELKTYLLSLDSEKSRAKADQVHQYRTRCNINNKKVRQREIQKITKIIDKQYETIFQIKNEIVALLKECENIPTQMEELEILKYMIYRVDIKSSENIVAKVIRRLGKRYNEIVELVEQKIKEFPELKNVEEIDFSVYKPKTDSLERAKNEYKLEYTEEERLALVQKELDIIEKAKQFNTIPIPHEILKNSDKDLQSKMQKFNNIRQKRLRVIATMETDYLKLQEPRKLNTMIDDAVLALEAVNEIMPRAEYNKVKSSLLKKRKKTYRNTNDIRNLIKAKERKTGIINYNVQEARYSRMETLRNIIAEATNIINANAIPGAEEQLEKLKISYQREKQYAAVIEKLEEESGGTGYQNTEVKAFEEQIHTLEYKIRNSKMITSEQTEKIKKAKKELIILWKMEIDTALTKRRETLELPRPKKDNNEDFNKSRVSSKRAKKRAFIQLGRARTGKHACVR